MIIRTGSLGDVEYDLNYGLPYQVDVTDTPVDVAYAYSDLSSYGLPQQVYVTDTPVDVAYAYSDTSGYTLPGTETQTAGGTRQTTGSSAAGGAWQTAVAQSPLTGQKMPSITQRQPVQQSSSGSMLLLVGAVGLGLFLGLS